MRAIDAPHFSVFDKVRTYCLDAMVLNTKKAFVTCVRIILIAWLTYSSTVVADQLALVEDRLPEDSGFRKPGVLAKADTSLASVFAEYSAHVDHQRWQR